MWAYRVDSRCSPEREKISISALSRRRENFSVINSISRRETDRSSPSKREEEEEEEEILCRRLIPQESHLIFFWTEKIGRILTRPERRLEKTMIINVEQTLRNLG